jgi:hypothetical protein
MRCIRHSAQRFRLGPCVAFTNGRQRSFQVSEHSEDMSKAQSETCEPCSCRRGIGMCWKVH